MTGQQAFALTHFANQYATEPRTRMVSWSVLAERLTTHREVPAKEAAPLWCGAVYREGAVRGKEGVDRVTLLVLDYDHAEPPWTLLRDHAYAAHTTYSHTEAEPRWRIILPLVQPVPGPEWESFWRRAQAHFGSSADEKCKDCSRIFFAPSHAPGAAAEAFENEGPLLDPDSIPLLPEPAAPAARPVGSAEAPSSAYLRKALDDETRAVATASRGARNDQLNKSSFALGQLVGAGVLERVLVESELEAAAGQCGLVTDDGQRTVSRSIRSGIEAGMAQPRHLPPPRDPYGPPGNSNGKVHHHQGPPPPDGPDDSGGEPPEQQPDAPLYHATDTGNAERLVAEYGVDLRYVGLWGKWLVWDGARFKLDTTGEAQRRAKATVRRMYRRAEAEDDDELRKALLKFALKSESQRSISDMLKRAQSERQIATDGDEFDASAWLLNVRNGTIDLKTAELKPHDRADLITKVAPVVYDPAAECPLFLSFLDRFMAGNQQLIGFLQQAMGYTLTGSVRERCVFILYGEGSNGKSTFVNVFQELLGPDYSFSAPQETFLAKRQTAIPNDLAALRGARFVSTIETNDGERIDEAKLKKLSGNDMVAARYMNGEWFNFRPHFKPWLATNHKPTIIGADKGIWSRIKLVPFLVTIKPEEDDKDFGNKLKSELSGILNWALEGCIWWQAEGLIMPSEVREATATYRSEMNPLTAWMEECCVIGSEHNVAAAALYESFKKWCEENGEKRTLSQTAFGRRLEADGYQKRRSHGGTRLWAGLALAGRETQGDLHG